MAPGKSFFFQSRRLALVCHRNHRTMEALARNTPSVELNNVAIAFVHSGRIQEAMELFQIGLSILRDQFHGNTPDTPRPDESMVENDDSAPVVASGEANDTNDSADDTETSCGTISVSGSDPVEIQLDSTFLAVYDRALVVDLDTIQPDDTRLSAVILFNMALLHHSRGLKHSNGDSLDRASRLYWFAIGILQMYHAPSANDLLLLALYNNVAHIDSYLFRIEQMKESLEQMRDLLRPPSGSGSGIGGPPIEEDDYNLFAVNAMYGRETSFRVAPAA
jgi:hypothetical protein